MSDLDFRRIVGQCKVCAFGCCNKTAEFEIVGTRFPLALCTDCFNKLLNSMNKFSAVDSTNFKHLDSNQKVLKHIKSAMPKNAKTGKPQPIKPRDNEIALSHFNKLLVDNTMGDKL